MARSILGSILNRGFRNELNRMLEELYDNIFLFNDGTGFIKNKHISDNAITSVKIAENAINDKHIADKTINGSKIANGTLHGWAIEPESITELRIGNRQISHRNMALGAIEDENISLKTKIQNKKLAPDQFTMSKGKTYPFFSLS